MKPTTREVGVESNAATQADRAVALDLKPTRLVLARAAKCLQRRDPAGRIDSRQECIAAAVALDFAPLHAEVPVETARRNDLARKCDVDHVVETIAATG